MKFEQKFYYMNLKNPKINQQEVRDHLLYKKRNYFFLCKLPIMTQVTVNKINDFNLITFQIEAVCTFRFMTTFMV